MNNVSPASFKVLQQLQGTQVPKPCPVLSVSPSSHADHSHATNAQVSATNNERLASLDGGLFAYEAFSKVMSRDDHKGHRYPVDQEICLKRGAYVMLVKNLEDEYFNGLTGNVVGFTTRDAFSLDPTSREWGDDWQDPHTIPIKSREYAKTDSTLWPVVEFTMKRSTKLRLMTPETFEIHSPTHILGRRKQIPVILAWSITIHKAQGQSESVFRLLWRTLTFMDSADEQQFPLSLWTSLATSLLDKVRACLFESRSLSAYVALSRARSLAELKIINLANNDGGKLKVDPDVYRWMLNGTISKARMIRHGGQ